MKRTWITQTEAARLLGVCVKTISRWDADGKLVAKRLPSGRPFYTQDQISSFLAVLGVNPDVMGGTHAPQTAAEEETEEEFKLEEVGSESKHPEIVTAAEAAVFLKTTLWSVYGWSRKGLLATAQDEQGRMAFKLADLQNFVRPRRGRKAGTHAVKKVVVVEKKPAIGLEIDASKDRVKKIMALENLDPPRIVSDPSDPDYVPED